MAKLQRIALAIVVFLLAALTVARLIRCWGNDSHLEHVSGAWVTLATDLTHGVFYRAAYGPTGYGGTRFFPLYFSLHAAAIKLFASWRATGYLLSFASVVLLLAGMYYLLRKAGLDRWLAAAGVLALLAGSSLQDSLLTIREDGMAAMFNVWAVVLCVDASRARRKLYAAAILFSLAFATKETSIFGVIAAVLWLAIQNQRATALRLALLSVVGYALVLTGIYFGSHGRVFEIFTVTMTEGTGIRNLFTSPAALVDTLSGYWAESILLALAAAALLARPRTISTLPGLLFVWALLATLAILSTKGAEGNHLLDLHVASVLLFLTTAAEWSEDFALSACAIAALIAATSFIPAYRDTDSVPLRSNYQEIVDTIGATEGAPILADNPLIPIIAGQTPYVADAFMFRVMAQKQPALAEPLWRMIDNRQFAAIVLQDNPDSDEGREIYTNTHFGGQFLQRLRRNYQPAGTPGDHYLYLPRR